MDLDDCQWVNCFLLPEPDYRNVEEEAVPPDESGTFLQELAPLKDCSEDEDDPDVVIQELAPLHVSEDVDLKDVKEPLPQLFDDPLEEELVGEPAEEVELKFSPSPVVSVDRLKNLLASQLKKPTLPGVPASTDDKLLPGTDERPALMKCDHCSTYFTKEALAAHLHTEICSTSFVCARCSRKFSSKAQFTLHLCLKDIVEPTSAVSMSKKKGYQTYQCTICTKTFLRYQNLINHAKTHLQETVIQCTICKKHFENNRKLINHLMTHRVNDMSEMSLSEGQQRPLSLPSAEKKSSVEARPKPTEIFLKVENPKLELEEESSCPNLNRTETRNKSNLPLTELYSENKAVSREPAPTDVEETMTEPSLNLRSRRTKCKTKLCSKTKAIEGNEIVKKLNKNSLLSRMSATLNGQMRRSYQACKICDKRFRSACQLRLHVQTHFVVCTICLEKFEDEEQLASHAKKCERVCRVCKRVLPSCRALKIHSGTCKVSCDVCEKKQFRTSKQLLEHQRVKHHKPPIRSSPRIRAK